MSIISRPPAIRRPIPHRRFGLTRVARPAPTIGLRPGEPEAARRRLREFLAIMAQLGLILAVFDTYRIESRSFRLLVLLATLTLPIHYLAHYRWKKPLFVAVSILGMFLAHGPMIAASVLGISAVLLMIVAAPLSWRLRVGLIAATAVGLALARPRGDAGPGAIATGFIPVIASMFMFRMILYLYERKHARGPEPLVDTLSYFFLLPNHVFPHFPVVDFRGFQRGYFARDINEIQRRGLEMIARGTLHLLGYRLIDRLLLLSPDAVDGPLRLAGYLVCNYLLYLRVSGQFHMACGILHLYGFQLPETHHHYLLASSFTDYWRRINIYWKDFMVRVVFNPVVFRLKRWPQPMALAIATAVVFVVTWLLHAYQSFWLRGVWGFGVTDALFWGLLGVLVVINVQLEARRTLRRRPGPAPAAPGRIARTLRIAGTFATITLLWSLWSSPSLGSWLTMMRRGLWL